MREHEKKLYTYIRTHIGQDDMIVSWKAWIFQETQLCTAAWRAPTIRILWISVWWLPLLAWPSEDYFQRRHGLTLQRKQPMLYCPFRAKLEAWKDSSICEFICKASCKGKSMPGISSCRDCIPHRLGWWVEARQGVQSSRWPSLI